MIPYSLFYAQKFGHWGDLGVSRALNPVIAGRSHERSTLPRTETLTTLYTNMSSFHFRFRSLTSFTASSFIPHQLRGAATRKSIETALHASAHHSAQGSRRSIETALHASAHNSAPGSSQKSNEKRLRWALTNTQIMLPRATAETGVPPHAQQPASPWRPWSRPAASPARAYGPRPRSATRLRAAGRT